MQKLTSLALALWAHGVIVNPSPRLPGPATKAACGETIFDNQISGNAGNIERLMQYAKPNMGKSGCNLWLCKGYQFADNKANVHSYSPGEVVPIKVKIAAPLTGYANVSIVDTASNSVIGRPLISWKSDDSTATEIAPDQTDFKITIPSNLSGCTTPGDCVIQWFWYGPPGVRQTYEGCIDFSVKGGSTRKDAGDAGGGVDTHANPIDKRRDAHHPGPNFLPVTFETSSTATPKGKRGAETDTFERIAMSTLITRRYAVDHADPNFPPVTTETSATATPISKRDPTPTCATTDFYCKFRPRKTGKVIPPKTTQAGRVYGGWMWA